MGHVKTNKKENQMKNPVLTIIILLTAARLFGQSIEVSENLTLIKLSENCYIHTQNNNNGMVYISEGDAIIVSTPDSDIETQELIDWVKKECKARIVGYIIDRWHTDAMEGLDVVKRNDIRSYSYELTKIIAKEKGLPVPEIGFDPRLELRVGANKVICHFLGEAHTKDGIVVWFPGEQVLFGGNGIRNHNGWAGNIGDANLEKWSETAERIKKEYGAAKVIVPGHGRHGGPELLDYTIELYKKGDRNWVLNKKEAFKRPDLGNYEDFLIISGSDSVQDERGMLKNATVYVQDRTKYVKIKSASLSYKAENKRVDSDAGYIEIYDKTPPGDILRIGVAYKKLILFRQDDSIGLRIILRGFEEE